MPQHNWTSDRRRDQAFLDHLLGKPQVAGVEDLELRLDLEVAQDRGALAQVIGGRDVGAVAVAEVEAAAIERRDIGPVLAFLAQVDHVAHAIFLRDEVGAGRRSVGHAMVADVDVATHAAGQVDEDVHLALADALDHLAVVPGLHAEDAGLGIAHVDVHHRRAGLRGLDCGLGDILRRDRAVRALGDLGVVAGDGAGDHDLRIHGGACYRLGRELAMLAAGSPQRRLRRSVPARARAAPPGCARAAGRGIRPSSAPASTAGPARSCSIAVRAARARTARRPRDWSGG